MNNLVLSKKENYVPQLDKGIVKKYICETATDKEIHFFLELCKAQNLNPFIREAYLVKYGTSDAQMVVGKEVFLKRAMKHPRYKGFTASVDGEIPNLTATCHVHVDGFKHPISVTVDYSEYVRKKKDGTPTQMWTEKPKTMLRKVALVQALREAFPEEFGGMYSQEEINTVNDNLPTEPINITPEKEVPKQLPLQKEVDMLQGCKNLEELKSVFSSFDKSTKKALEDVKDEMKRRLTPLKVEMIEEESKKFDFEGKVA